MTLPPLPLAAFEQGYLRQFTPSERLGGELTLQDLNAPPLPPLALAEQARLRRSSDPFGALSEPWRRPWRRIMASTPRVRWRPVRRLVASWPGLPAVLLVPVLLHSDGSVDVFLDAPGSAPVAAALEALLERLDTPPSGSVQPLQLELQPRPLRSSPQ